MTIRHLKIFIAVADSGKMRRAAEILYISQPTVSQAIKELENYYQVQLFERLSQRLYITDSGKLLLSYARHIVSSFETMEEALRSAEAQPIIKIGGSVSVGTVLLADFVDKLETQMCGVEAQITVDNTSEIERKILTSQLDLAIVEGSVESSEIVVITVCEDELVLVVGEKHPFYNNNRIKLSQLQNQPLISREQGSADRNQFEQLLAENNISMHKKWCCTNTETIKSAVVGGKGIAILSKMLVKEEIATGKLKILCVENVNVKRNIKLIYHKNKFISKPMETFINICKTREQK